MIHEICTSDLADFWFCEDWDKNLRIAAFGNDKLVLITGLLVLRWGATKCIMLNVGRQLSFKISADTISSMNIISRIV